MTVHLAHCWGMKQLKSLFCKNWKLELNQKTKQTSADRPAVVQQRSGCVWYSGGRVPNTVPRVRWRQQSSEESNWLCWRLKGRVRAKINSALVFLLNVVLTCQEHCCDVNTNPVVWPNLPCVSSVWTAFGMCDCAKVSKRYFFLLLLLLFYKNSRRILVFFMKTNLPVWQQSGKSGVSLGCLTRHAMLQFNPESRYVQYCLLAARGQSFSICLATVQRLVKVIRSRQG